MSKSLRKSAALFLFAILTFSVVSVAHAQASEGEKSVTSFFRRLFNWGPKAVQETGGMTANALNNTGEKVIEPTAANTTAIAQGDLAKTGDLVAEPVVGALENSGQAVSETVQVPVKAAEEEVAPAVA